MRASDGYYHNQMTRLGITNEEGHRPALLPGGMK